MYLFFLSSRWVALETRLVGCLLLWFCLTRTGTFFGFARKIHPKLIGEQKFQQTRNTRKYKCRDVFWLAGSRLHIYMVVFSIARLSKNKLQKEQQRNKNLMYIHTYLYMNICRWGEHTSNNTLAARLISHSHIGCNAHMSQLVLFVCSSFTQLF